jgi:glycosyltransferase involved in cell wall biosynthesis
VIFHVVSLPHTNTTEDFTACAFTEKVRKFCIMMKNLGHTVYLYGGEFNEAPCDEHIVCITEEQRLAAVGSNHYSSASFDWNLPYWVEFNQNVINGIQERLQHKDFICLIAGLASKQIADAFPDELSVEFGIGYAGTFAKYRVFESYAWMHSCYGSKVTNPNALDGKFYDAVIPGYIDVKDFPFREEPDDYYLYMGRLIERKGYQIAVDVCKQLGKRLIIAGHGTVPEYGEYVGVVGTEERAKLMGGAIATFAPTIYVEPFGTVAIEAMACGTPVISTDWGAFTETVIDGVTGFRCHILGEFIDAVNNAKNLDRKLISQYAKDRYGLDTVALMYDKYFHRLETLWDGGWYYDGIKTFSI